LVERVDTEKANRIVEIEELLNNQQAEILQLARAEIDRLNQKAANLKIGVLQEAQARVAVDTSEITARAARLGPLSTVNQSTGTTTIKTEVSAATTTKDAGSSATAKRESSGRTSGATTSTETKTKTVENITTPIA